MEKAHDKSFFLAQRDRIPRRLGAGHEHNDGLGSDADSRLAENRLIWHTFSPTGLLCWATRPVSNCEGRRTARYSIHTTPATSLAKDVALADKQLLHSCSITSIELRAFE
jgi:hypothetical protein